MFFLKICSLWFHMYNYYIYLHHCDLGKTTIKEVLVLQKWRFKKTLLHETMVRQLRYLGHIKSHCFSCWKEGWRGRRDFTGGWMNQDMDWKKLICVTHEDKGKRVLNTQYSWSSEWRWRLVTDPSITRSHCSMAHWFTNSMAGLC